MVGPNDLGQPTADQLVLGIAQDAMQGVLVAKCEATVGIELVDDVGCVLDQMPVERFRVPQRRLDALPLVDFRPQCLASLSLLADVAQCPAQLPLTAVCLARYCDPKHGREG